MHQRRILINFKPAGWLAWLLVALLAVPLLILSFFFIAAAVLLAAVIVALTAVRIYWLVRTARKRQPFASWNEGRQRGGEVIDIEAAEIGGANAAPPGADLPRLQRTRASDENGDRETMR